MKRSIAFAVTTACLGLGLWGALDGGLESDAWAQKGKGKPPVTAKPKDGGVAAQRDGGVAPTEQTAPPPAQRVGGDSGVVEAKTVDGGRVFKFGELEVEGRLRSPQIVYFLRRVRAEFAAGELGHRSFMGELSQTRNAQAF
jgi:hypothetical protein